MRTPMRTPIKKTKVNIDIYIFFLHAGAFLDGGDRASFFLSDLVFRSFGIEGRFFAGLKKTCTFPQSWLSDHVIFGRVPWDST